MGTSSSRRKGQSPQVTNAKTVRKLMVIRMNYILGEKFGWLNDLEEYLDQSSIVCIKNRN